MAYDRRNYTTKKGNLTKDEFLAKKKEKMNRQTKNIDMITAVAKYLDDILQESPNSRISVRDVIDHLLTKGYSAEDTKDIAQTNYIMVELANAQKNNKISGDRTNIRVLYLEERLKTSYMKELHERIENLIKEYIYLFRWDTESTGEEYDVEFVSK